MCSGVCVCVGQTSESNLPRTASEVERGRTFLIFSYEKFIQ